MARRALGRVSRTLVRGLCVAAVVAAAGCGEGNALLRMALADGDCTPAKLAKINSLEVVLSDVPPRVAPCVTLAADVPRTVAEIQQTLHDAVAFRDLSEKEGELAVTVRGHLDQRCAQTTGLCGKRVLALSREEPDPVLSLYCWGGDERAEYDACSPGATSGVLQLELGPNRCSDLRAHLITAARLQVGDHLGLCERLPIPSINEGYEQLQARLRGLLRLEDPPDSLELKLWLYRDLGCSMVMACASAETFSPPFAPELPLRCENCPPLP